MKLKQISAGTMQEAMVLARKELGEDAVLLESKKVQGGNVVVTFAVEAEDVSLFDESLIEDPGAVLPFSPHIPRATAARVEINHPAIGLIAEALSHHAVPIALAEKILFRAHQAQLKPDALIATAES